MNQTGWGGADCHLCEKGKSTFTLDSQQSCMWCKVANTFRDGVSKKADGRVLKVKKKANKENGKMDFVAYEHFYQDELGQPECKECRFNRQKGAGICINDGGEDEGAIVCFGFFREDEDCKKEQKIVQSIMLAYFFFATLIAVGIPFMFFSGGLGALSHVWRKDTALLINIMRSGTEQGVFLMGQRNLIYQRRVREGGCLAAFREHEDAEGLADLDDLRPAIEMLGTKKDFFAEFKETAWSCIVDEHGEPDASQGKPNEDLNAAGAGDLKIRVSYPQFRELLSILAHRISFARKNDLYYDVFRLFDEDGGGTLDEAELEKVAAILGRKFTSAERKILMTHANTEGDINPQQFVQAMHMIDMSERRQKLLENQELKEERYEKAFDHYRIEGHGPKEPDYLDTISFRLATSSLGFLWSMEQLHLAYETEFISQLDINRGDDSYVSPWAKSMLRSFEGNSWALFVVIIVFVQLGAEYLYRISSNEDYMRAYTIFEVAIIIFFLVEICMKMYLYKKVKKKVYKFFTRVLNIIDFIVVLMDFLFLIYFGLLWLRRVDVVGPSRAMNTIRTFRIIHILKIARVARAVRLLRGIGIINKSCNTFLQRLMHPCDKSEKVTYTIFRRFLSCVALHNANDYPFSRWRDGFRVFDVEDHGFIPMSAFDHGLLHAAGIFVFLGS